jgi:hypothetical protein
MIQYASYSVDQLIFGNSASGCDQISLRQVSQNGYFLPATFGEKKLKKIAEITQNN